MFGSHAALLVTPNRIFDQTEADIGEARKQRWFSVIYSRGVLDRLVRRRTATFLTSSVAFDRPSTADRGLWIEILPGPI